MTGARLTIWIRSAKSGLLAATAMALALGAAGGTAPAQYSRPSSYSDYYLGNVEQYLRPPTNPGQYTIDRYFYQRPTISPYLNLLRPRQGVLPNYQTLVVPEAQRRSNASSGGPYQNGVMAIPSYASGLDTFSSYQGYRGGAGTLGTRQAPKPSPTGAAGFMSTYYSHWYGGGTYGR